MFIYWMIATQFVLVLISLGVGLARIGEPRKGTHGITEVIFAMLFSVLWGMALAYYPVT
jgi:hypothetical protein